MKGKWLAFVMSRRRVRICPWGMRVVKKEEASDDTRASPSGEGANGRLPRLYAGRPGRFRRNGRMRDDAESAGSTLRRLSRARSRTVGVRRSRDGLQPNRVD
jgi:hypothetical protein